MKKASAEDRIKFLRHMIYNEVKTHGTPCMCVLCETLVFDTLFAEGTRDIKEALKRMK